MLSLCVLVVHYFLFIFELQMIHQVREKRNKGKAGLHSWAFSVICGPGVEVSEFFYLCPELGVMKSMMVTWINWYASRIFTSLLNNLIWQCCAPAFKCNWRITAWAGWLSLCASLCTSLPLGTGQLDPVLAQLESVVYVQLGRICNITSSQD